MRWGVVNVRRTVALMVVAAVSVAGCGRVSTAGGTAQKPVEVLAAAYGKTVAAHTARVSIAMSLRVKDQSVNWNADGPMDFAARAADLKMTFNFPTQTIQGEGRVINGVMYEKIGSQPWRSQPLPPAATAPGSATDPSQLLSYLQGVSGDVTKVGTATIRGIQTTEYRASVDLSKTGNGGGMAQAQASQVANQLGTTIEPMWIWVDGQGVTRQIQVNLTPRAGSLAASQGLSAMQFTMDFYDFGIPVHVTVPT